MYEGEYKGDKKEGRGTCHYASGNVYEGEWKRGEREGRGTYRYADGDVDVGRSKAGAPVGEGARWSADGKTAWRLTDGEPVETISLQEAAAIAARVGEPVPASASGLPSIDC